MSSPSTQFATSRRMGIYEPLHQISMWGDTFKGDSSPNTGASTIEHLDARVDNKAEYNSHESLGPSENDQEANKPTEKSKPTHIFSRHMRERERERKEERAGSNSDPAVQRLPSSPVQRRLAQNREAARKSRLRKKAYVQQLETSRLKLTQMEQELTRTKQQGMPYCRVCTQGVHLILVK